jgi:hypothetical protein
MKRGWKATIALGCAVAFAVACGSSARNGFNDGTTPGDTTGDGGGSLGGGNIGEGGSKEGGLVGSAPQCADASCACALAMGSWDGKTCTLTENPGNVDAATQAKLTGGGSADNTFKLVYPYDNTVFAGGLTSPTLQWNGTATDATYVHVSAPGVDYKGWFGKSNPGRAQITKAAWNVITIAPKPTDPVKVEITKISGGNVTGPATQTWKMAAGSLRGAIYYETYGSAILGGIASVGIMKINPGATKPVPIASGCGNVCHTASADGSTLVSATGFIIGSQSYDLKNNAKVIKTQGDQSFVYGGLTPNGKLSMSATNYRTWTGGASKLYDTTTGAVVSAPGWDGVVSHAAMPSFAPDGTAITFNHQDNGKGHNIATMAYAAGTHTFSGLSIVATDPVRFLGWPAFTPDTKTVVYHAGTSNAYETDASQDDAGANIVSYGSLWAVDVATKKTVRLDKLNGYSGATSYLPASDPDLNFTPTVLPEAVGGYFWVVFTSHRSYGNTLPTQDNKDQNGKLWVAAIDINPTPGADPSHPAFYLDGQESGADNLRGFWVLDPCKDDGNGCASGDECCGGYCRPNSNGLYACVTNPGGCSFEYEKCTTATDCCGQSSQCINGKCAAPAVK